MRALPLLLALIASPAPAASQEAFAIDPVHTRVLVSVDHAGFSRALGTVSGATGSLRFGERWEGASVEVVIPLAHLDFGDPAWNRAVAGMLGTARHPRARFASSRVTPIDDRDAEVCGMLELNGVSRPTCMRATFNALKRHPLPPFRRTIGFSAVARLDRSDFGIDRWSSMIGREVDLRIEVEATRGIAAPDSPSPAGKSADE